MEDFDSSVQLKEKLLVAGIDEIANHGVKDFSLRRVAAACGASCAAPYKHFKNKEEFIEQIIGYVEKRWNLLATQISSAISDDRQRIAELCVANIRFKIANPIYTVGSSDDIIAAELKTYCDNNELSNGESRIFAVSALVAGTAALIECGKLENKPETLELLRSRVLSELE
ncbi:MAG: TetR family transcriptional regulator [Firmicutes bacterium]|nr:TetR family transcriptional regulator [Bacillota bacterium]